MYLVCWAPPTFKTMILLVSLEPNGKPCQARPNPICYNIVG